jgi:phosphoribosylaminoimidazolecarboxamide formyltransferase/IMP cyclohydrolase
MERIPIRTALLSVWDKSGITEFAQALHRSGVRLISTGGTFNHLSQAGIPVLSVEKYTRSREILGGRVKTLHPKIYAGILARRDHPEDMKLLKQKRILPLDLVVVNLYPFEKVSQRDGVALTELLEMVDIGGPAMIRAGGKNHLSVVVVVDPGDYPRILSEMEKGGVPVDLSQELAVKAFQHTAYYDSVIFQNFAERYSFTPDRPIFVTGGRSLFPLRYGENPHQKGSFYILPSRQGRAIEKVLEGKTLSYNNIQDCDRALRIVLEFSQPCCAIIKHTNPCGVALSERIADAYMKAYETDPQSAFGSVVAVNRVVDVELAEALKGHFVECIVAPGVDPQARELLEKKKNLRIVVVNPWPREPFPRLEFRSSLGGVLVQEADLAPITAQEFKVVSRLHPDEKDLRDLEFALRVCRHVSSNAIVIARSLKILGIGAGQMSRVDAVRIAIEKAQEPLQGAVLASDAFFPFRDSVDISARAGIHAIVQPGGSIRDPEVISAADEHGIAMVFCRHRHFRH